MIVHFGNFYRLFKALSLYNKCIYFQKFNSWYLRFISLMSSFSLEFALNAIFFTNDQIDKESEAKLSNGHGSVDIWFIIIQGVSRYIWPVIISLIIGIIIHKIRLPNAMVKNEFNEALITNDKYVIKSAYIVYQKKMKCRYIIFLSIISIMNLFCWYFVICFCSVYLNSNKSWIIGSFISIAIDSILVKLSLIFITAVIWKLAKETKVCFWEWCYKVVRRITKFTLT